MTPNHHRFKSKTPAAKRWIKRYLLLQKCIDIDGLIANFCKDEAFKIEFEKAKLWWQEELRKTA